MKKTFGKENILPLVLFLFICFILFLLDYTGFFESLALIFKKLSFRFFNSTSEFASFFPLIFLTLFPTGILFSYLEKIKNENFARLICIILILPTEYLIIAKLSAPNGIMLCFLLCAVFALFKFLKPSKEAR